MNDTSPEIESMVRELMMNRSGVERMKMAAGMFDAARAIVISSLSPELDEIAIRERLCERFYRQEVDVSAFLLAIRSLQRTPG
jgi:hypothetical protein